MKNIPERIYLQVGDECEASDDFKDLDGVTWCADNVFDTDIEYKLVKTKIPRKIK